jgi:hypothetical protein
MLIPPLASSNASPPGPRTPGSAIEGPQIDSAESSSYINNPARGTDVRNCQRKTTEHRRRIFEANIYPLLVEKGNEGAYVSNKR